MSCCLETLLSRTLIPCTIKHLIHYWLTSLIYKEEEVVCDLYKGQERRHQRDEVSRFYPQRISYVFIPPGIQHLSQVHQHPHIAFVSTEQREVKLSIRADLRRLGSNEGCSSTRWNGGCNRRPERRLQPLCVAAGGEELDVREHLGNGSIWKLMKAKRRCGRKQICGRQVEPVWSEAVSSLWWRKNSKTLLLLSRCCALVFKGAQTLKCL